MSEHDLPRIASTQEIIAELRAGRMVVLVDEEDRENEGDLVLAADHVTPEAINFMARFGRGLICLTLTEQRCRQLGLNQMARDNKAQFGTAFTVSIEAAEGVTTGISAHDRARTIQAAVNAQAKPSDIVQPGHIFPIMARPGGVLVRAGHTEAGCDLASLAGLTPASVICEIMSEDGSMARLPELKDFAASHGLKIGTIADLIHYRSQHETLVGRSGVRPIATRHGNFTLHTYTDKASDEVHLALVKGALDPAKETLVRVHVPLSVLDFLAPEGTGHSVMLEESMVAIGAADQGVLVMLHKPLSGHELLQGLIATDQQIQPRKWDPLLHGIGAQILRDLGVKKMRLLASPQRIPAMTGFDLEVTGFQSPDGTRTNV
jgi:3,4-dihydroxy 2-butanone 4-phosphate synthase / GTP cyclohydrolase II